MAKQQLEFEATVSAAQLNKLLQDLRTGGEDAARTINSALGGTVKKTIFLETREDASGARNLIAVEKQRLSVTDRIAREQERLNNIQRGSVTSLRQQVNEAKQARDQITRYQQSVGGLSGSIRTVNGEWSKQNARVSELSRQLALAEASGFWDRVRVGLNAQGLFNFSNGLVAVTQGLQAASIVVGQFLGSLNQVINTAADLQQFSLTFQAIGQGSTGGADALQRAARIALGLGTNLQTVEQAFQQLSPVVLNVGGNIDDVGNITQALSSRFAAFGISGDKARRVMNGVIQAFAKGKLQAEELTQQISEADPAFKTDLAGAIGVTTSELEKMVKAGELTAEKLIDLIPKLSKSALLFGKLGPTANTAVDALEKGSVTIAQVRANLDTLNQLSLRNLAQQFEPVINAVFRIQAVITDFLNRISQFSGVETLGNIFARLLGILTRVVDSFLVLVEGALRVIDAISPLVNGFLAIPGALEVVALAIAGKFIKPLGLLEKKAASVLQSQGRFINGLKNIWSGSTAQIVNTQKAIEDFRGTISRPLGKVGLNETGDSLKGIATGAKSVVTSVATAATSTIDQVDSAATAAEAKADRLRKRLRLLELEAQRTKTVPGVEQAVAPSLTSGLKGASTAFLLANRNLNQFSLSAKGTVGITKELASQIGKASLLTQKVLEGVPDKVLFRPVDPKFIQDIEVLSKTDPATALTLLNTSLAQFQREMQKATAAADGFDNVSKTALQAKAAENVGLLTSAIAGLESRLSGQQTSLRSEIQKTEVEYSRLKAELSKAPRDGLSKKAIQDQQALRQALIATEQKLGDLRSAQEELRVAGRRTEVGFDPAQYKAAEPGLNRYIDLVKKAKIEEELAASSRVQELRASSAAASTVLDDLASKYQKIAQQSAARGVPIEPGALYSERDLKIADAYRGVISRNAEELARLEDQIRTNVAANTDLAKVLQAASGAGAKQGDQIKALSLIGSVYSAAIEDNITKIREYRTRIDELRKTQADLAKTQAARSFDPALAAESAKQLRETGDEIRNLEARIVDLGNSNKDFEEKNKNVSRSLKNLRAESTATGRAIGVTGRAIRGLTGIAVAPFKGIASLATSAGGAVAGLVASLGPLQAILLAVGLASRLYADGNRDAANATKDFKDQTDLLNKAIDDIAPGTTTAAASSSSLARAWDALAVATVSVVDRIGSALERVAGFVANLVSQIKLALGPTEEFISKIALLGGSAVLGGIIGTAVGFGPWGTAIGAALGAAAGGILGLGLAADATTVNLEKFRKKSQEILAGAQAQTPVISKLAAELSRLAVPGKGVEAKNLTKFSNGLDQIGAALDLQKRGLKEFETALTAGQSKYDDNIKKIEQLRTALALAGEERTKLAEKNQREFETFKALGGDPSGFVQTPGLKEAGEKVNRLRNQLKALEEETIKVGTANGQTEDKIAKLRGEIEKGTAEYDKLAAATGRVTSEQKDLLNSTGKLEEAIKQLNDSAKGYDLKTEKGRKGFDETISRAQDLQAILDFVSKTKYEINIETKKLDESIRDAQIRIDLEPGPVREVAQLANKINNDIDIAGQEFAKASKAAEAAQKEGSISQKDAAERVGIAAREYLQKTRDGAANLIDAVRNFREQLQDAVNSLRNLKLSNPNFFTRGELRANAQEIEREFAATLERVRRETGDLNFFPRLEGKTSDEILQAKQRFIEVRKESDDLNKKIGDISNSLGTITQLLAKIAGVELKALKEGGVDVKDTLGEIQGKTKEVATETGTIGEIYGTIAADGKEYILFLNKATGETETLTKAQFEARKESDRLAAANAAAAKRTAAAQQQAANAGKQATSQLGEAANAAQKNADTIGTAQAKAAQTVSRIGEILGNISGGGQEYVIFWDKITQSSQVLTKEAFNRLKADEASGKALANQANEIQKISEGLPGILGTGSFAEGSAASIFLPPGLMDSVVAEAKAIGTEVGGAFQGAISEFVDRRLDSPLFSPTAVLFDAKSAVADYRLATEDLAAAKQIASQAEQQYALVTAAGIGGVEQASVDLQNAYQGVADAQDRLNSLESPYQEALQDLREYNIELSSVPTEPGNLHTEMIGQVDTLQQSYSKAVDEARRLYEANNQLQSTGNLSENTDQFSQNIEDGASALQNASGAASDTNQELINAAQSAQSIKSSIESLQGLQVNVDVNYNGAPPRWTGGPVSSGTQYRVNELGREGFLSTSGRISEISRPQNSLWRAPSSGTVIPAHIWAQMKAPKNGVEVSGGPTSNIAAADPVQRLARVIRNGMGGNARDTGMQELASVQATQAMQIGKLGRAVDQLASKDWNVNVRVKNTGTAAYLQALNHRM